MDRHLVGGPWVSDELADELKQSIGAVLVLGRLAGDERLCTRSEVVAVEGQLLYGTALVLGEPDVVAATLIVFVVLDRVFHAVRNLRDGNEQPLAGALLLVEHAGELVDVGKRIGPVLKADRKVSAVDRYDQL